jgi:predicted ATPase
LLSGEPGIGKSRLTAALMESLVAEPHTRLRYFCSPQHTNSAFYPIITQMERAAGFVHDDTTQAKLNKLDALLAQSATPHQDAALFGEMLSLTNDGRFPKLELPPQQRRQKTLEALTAQLETLSSTKPVLMIFEDAHWVDPTSLEALGRAVDLVRTRGLLLVVTYRLEFEPPWIGQPHVTALTLNRLGEREIAAMIDRLTGNKLLPVGIRQDIIERTDGIPLFAEEITKAALEADSEGAAEGAIAAVPSPSLAVPASLHASLMARLDRLGPAKEVAQIGAVIGREFPHAVLSAAFGKPETELQFAIDSLVKAGLLFQQGIPPHATYLFKHALVQDAAYSTLLRDPRRVLHARIGKALEGQFSDIAENQPEVLARHFTEAGLTEKAAGFWGKAGQRSLARSALVEAIAQLSRALDQIAALPSTPALRREQMKLYVALLTPTMHVNGHASPETRAVTEKAQLLIEQMEALGEQLEDPLLLFSILYGFWVGNYMAFKADAMRELSGQFLSFAQKQKTSAALVVGHRLVATSLMLTGDVVESRAHFDRALSLYDPTQHIPLAARFGQDLRVATLAYRSWALWLLGYPQSALIDVEQGLKNAREIDQAAGLMYALIHTAIFHLFSKSWEPGKVEADELVQLATGKGVVFWKAQGLLAQGCLAVSTGKAVEGVDLIRSGMTALRQTGANAFSSFYSCYLAVANAELGRYDEAGGLIEDVVRDVETTKQTWWAAEAHRIAGEIALKRPETSAAMAEAHFEKALAIALHQQAKSWELRAAMSLARLWRDQGNVQQARELLAPVYGWFTEGFETRDLKEAKALLEELGS